ncbi:hypothetical protein [Methyloceanibacter stevinii]|uniref:hypothetical protein n=1 Tax=Methyloceanibacter stevinii TaxID=1774970 RepID=UPI0019D330F8|nr:hypothetical protein [Methyloceanibacter stevinii]
MKETLRNRLDATSANAKPRNLLAAFERARAPHVEAAAQDLGADDPRESGASEDMLPQRAATAQAAAAQAAALAESREERPVRREPRVDLAADDQSRNRKRPYLIISAAVLLTISALLLYGRLGSKSADDTRAIPQSGAALPSGEAPSPEASNQTVPAAPWKRPWMRLWRNCPAISSRECSGLRPSLRPLPCPGSCRWRIASAKQNLA